MPRYSSIFSPVAPWLGCIVLKVILCTAALLPIAAQAQSVALHRYTFSHPQMGTVFNLIVYAPDSTAAHQACSAAIARIDSLNRVFSDYLPDSELNRLSATAGTGQEVRVSEPLWEILVRAQKISARTNGLFDVSVGPIVNLWRRARRQGELPARQALNAALEAVGYQSIHLNAKNRTVRLEQPGMRLDLGGIAKGFAADEALKVLQAHGIHSALIDAGGDITLGEAPPGKKGWEVAVGIPGETDSLTLLICRKSVATSGDFYQFTEIDGIRYSHIVDPRTGLGITQPRMVAVIAPDGSTADALASALSVSGPEKAASLMRKFRGASARIVWKSKGQWQEKKFRRFGN